MNKLVKIFFVLVYYAIVMFLYNYAYNNFFFNESIILGTFLYSLVFTSILISTLWLNVYSFSFHYYLAKIEKIMFMCLLTAAIMALSVCSLYYLITNITFFSVYNLINLSYYIFGSMITVSLFHYLQFKWIKHLGKLGYFQRNVLVIGQLHHDFDIKNHFDDIWSSRSYSGNLHLNSSGELEFINYNGENETFNDYEGLIYKRNIGEVFIFKDENHNSGFIEPIKRFLISNTIPYTIFSENVKVNRFIWHRDFNILPYIERLDISRNGLKSISIKRLASIILSVTTIVVGAPIWLIIALSIKLYDKGPVFYVSKRVGKNGKVFDFYKFRTMIVNADKLKENLMKDNQRKDGPLFKMKNDPRVTPLGSILRKFSLDEMPQLLNILKGEMCFIGPRPHLPSEVQYYTDRDYLRLECIPGLSCLPQIRDRNNIGFREWVELDLYYRNHWSILLDLKIFIKTIGVAISPLFSKHGGH